MKQYIKIQIAKYIQIYTIAPELVEGNQIYIQQVV